jgi:hypothetical protein
MRKLIKTAFLFLLILDSSSLLNSQTPVPQAAFGIYLGGSSVTVKDLLAQKSINVLCPPCDSTIRFTVMSHRIVTYPKVGKSTEIDSDNNTIPTASRNAINLLKPGDNVFVEAIVVRAAQGKVVMDNLALSPIILTIR